MELTQTTILFLFAVLVSAALVAFMVARRFSDRRPSVDELYRQLFERTRDAVIVATPDDRPLRVNPAALELYGFDSEEEMLQLDLGELHLDEDARRIREQHLQESGFVTSYETRQTVGSGEVKTIQETTSSVHGDDGSEILRLSILRDVTIQKEREEHLLNMAQQDALTRLPNRYTFQYQLDRALAMGSRFGRRPAVLMLDLDHFKEVNDTYGHAAGDALLRIVAQRLDSRIRKVDVVARLGGDEFAVIKTEVQQARHVGTLAEILLQTIEPPIDLDGTLVRVGMSIGISVWEPGMSAAQLLRQADMALYRSKEKGRNNYHFYDEAMDRDVQEKLTLDRELRDALDNDQFVLSYMPRFSLGDRRLRGVETMVVWRHPERGVIGPDGFQAAIEHNGVVVQLGEWMIRIAAEMIRAWSADPRTSDLVISIPLSPVQLRGPDLPATIEAILDATGFHPGRLEVGIPESSLVEQLPAVENVARRLAELEVGLYLDNHGSGFASPDCLYRLPFRRVQISSALVGRLESDPGAQAILAAIIAAAEHLGLGVTASGVETVMQHELLQSRGCGEALGDLFSPALSFQGLVELLGSGEIRALRPH